ncbi:class I SAM-dependent methyltransferase [Devosia sp. CAU 1758]
MADRIREKTEQTIADFGDQWSRYTDNDGFYASQEMFADIVGPLLPTEALAGARCAEVGAGSGRITLMLLRCGAAHVTAIEPSRAAEVLRLNIADFADKVTIEQERGDKFAVGGLDYVVSIGVLHHIPDPGSTVQRMFQSLRPGGQALIWLYGREGNAAYLSVVEPLRWVTQKLPVQVNAGIAWLLYVPLAAYIRLCRWLPLPMHHYMRSVLAPLAKGDVHLVIVDQLNPAWAKYYREDEARELLAAAGFTDVTLYHRHGYSWTVRGTRPE